MCIDHTPDTPALKTCSTCGIAKPATVDFFKARKSGKDGLAGKCKACDAEYNRAHYEANKEYRLKKQREWHNKHPEYSRSFSEYYRTYRLVNKGRIAEYNRDYYSRNKELRAEQVRAWRKSNVDAYRAIVRRRHARERGAKGTHTAEDVANLYEAQNGRCYYCKVKVGDDYHVDHVIPLSRGGSNGPENIVIACPTCNTSKQDKMPHEWPQGGRLL